MERAGHSVNHLLSLSCLFVALVVFHVWFRGRDFGSDCASSWSLLNFYFLVALGYLPALQTFVPKHFRVGSY